MHNLHRFVSFCAAVVAFNSVSSEAGASADVFTPVVASTLSSEAHPILGTDGVYHVVYELQLTNTKLLPATMQKIEVLAGSAGSQVINSFNDAANIPKLLEHRLHLIGAPNPGPAKPAPLNYVVAPLKIADAKPLIIGPPLAGPGWVAANGCCNPDITHRGSVQSVNGALYNSQRFAIDWMRLDEHGALVHGDESDVHNYSDYGADVLAVANAKVVSVLNNLDNQVPGRLPEESSVTTE